MSAPGSAVQAVSRPGARTNGGLLPAVLVLLALGAAAGFYGSAARMALWPGSETVARLGSGLLLSAAAAAAAFWLSRRSAPSALAARAGPAGVVALGLVSLGIGLVAFDAFPNSADEYGFLFAAETLARGRVANPVPPDPDLFRQVYLIAQDGIWVSQYLPAWPAALAAALLLGLPPLLATALATVAALLVLRRAAGLEGAPPAVAWAAALACGASSFVVLNGATYFSHAPSAALALGAIAAWIRAERPGGVRWAALSGLCFGLLALTRLDSAAVLGATLACGWALSGFRPGLALWAALGALPGLGLLGAFDAAITGSPLVPPTVWAGNLTVGAGGVVGVEHDVDPSRRAAVFTLWRAVELADTASPLLPALWLWAVAARLRARRFRFYDLLPVFAVALFLVFPDYGGWQMGPRYWFDGYVAMHLTVAAWLGAQAPRRAAASGTLFLLLLVPAQLARLPFQADFWTRTMAERMAPFRLAAALPPDAPAVVLIDNFRSAFNARFNRGNQHYAHDFMRNAPDFDQRVTFAHADRADALRRACAALPGATPYRFEIGPEIPEGRLVPLSCPP